MAARGRPSSLKFVRKFGGPSPKGQGRMANESTKSVMDGLLGHLPPWPRKALNNSVIGMEQAYRQRKGLPLLTDADIEALKAGQPMPWESGDGASADSLPTPAPATSAAEPPSSVPLVTTSAPAAGISEEVAKWVATGKKWSKSTIAAEQSRRGRKGLPALNDAEIAALLGEAVAPAAPASIGSGCSDGWANSHCPSARSGQNRDGFGGRRCGPQRRIHKLCGNARSRYVKSRSSRRSGIRRPRK